MATPIAIAVVEHEGRYLIGQRPPGVPLAGLWEFPGGKIELGETPENAAVRECLEEAGVVVEPLFRYSDHLQEYAHGQVQLAFVACRALAGSDIEPRPPFRWVPRTDLCRYPFPAGNQSLLELLRTQ